MGGHAVLIRVAQPMPWLTLARQEPGLAAVGKEQKPQPKFPECTGAEV